MSASVPCGPVAGLVRISLCLCMGQKKLVTKEVGETEGVPRTPALPTGRQVEIAKKSSTKQVINGVANVTVSYNNTMISIADTKGEILAWASSGTLGFKGTKKSTPYAAGLVARNVIEKARRFNLVNLRVVVRGIGPGRESAIRSLAAGGLNITALTDRTPIAHNGVKSPKPRRV